MCNWRDHNNIIGWFGTWEMVGRWGSINLYRKDSVTVVTLYDRFNCQYSENTTHLRNQNK